MLFPENVTRLCSGKSFSFGCHPGVPCFTECCRELELALTPYDVLRLCCELQMRGADFIERYVVVEQDANEVFPRLYLGMVDDGRASCPFISAKGCSVYMGRPGACRAYPVGRGAVLDGNGNRQEIYVLVREEHCRGFAEPDRQTAAKWFEDQGLTEYNAMNDETLTLIQHKKVNEGFRLDQEQYENFMLALYRVDEFREKVRSSAFQTRAALSAEERKAVLADDRELLRFGIRWLKDIFFAEKE